MAFGWRTMGDIPSASPRDAVAALQQRINDDSLASETATGECARIFRPGAPLRTDGRYDAITHERIFHWSQWASTMEACRVLDPGRRRVCVVSRATYDTNGPLSVVACLYAYAGVNASGVSAIQDAWNEWKTAPSSSSSPGYTRTTSYTRSGSTSTPTTTFTPFTPGTDGSPTPPEEEGGTSILPWAIGGAVVLGLAILALRD